MMLLMKLEGSLFASKHFVSVVVVVVDVFVVLAVVVRYHFDELSVCVRVNEMFVFNEVFVCM